MFLDTKWFVSERGKVLGLTYRLRVAEPGLRQSNDTMKSEYSIEERKRETWFFFLECHLIQ